MCITHISDVSSGILGGVYNFVTTTVGAILGSPLRSYRRELNKAKDPVFLGTSFILLVVFMVAAAASLIVLQQRPQSMRTLEEGRLAESLSKQVVVDLGGSRDDTRRVTAEGLVGDMSFWIKLERSIGSVARHSSHASTEIGKRCAASMPLASVDLAPADGQLSRAEAERVRTKQLPNLISLLPMPRGC